MLVIMMLVLYILRMGMATPGEGEDSREVGHLCGLHTLTCLLLLTLNLAALGVG